MCQRFWEINWRNHVGPKFGHHLFWYQDWSSAGNQYFGGVFPIFFASIHFNPQVLEVWGFQSTSIPIAVDFCGWILKGFLDQQSWFWKLHNGGSSLLYNWLIFGMLMRFCWVKLGFVAIWMWKTNTWFPPSNWGPSQSASVIPYRNYNNVSKAIIHHPYVVHSTRFAPHGKFWTGLLLRFTVTWWWQM